MPVMRQEKSSRNWNFRCSVVCGVFVFVPMWTPLGNFCSAAPVRAST